MLQFSDKFQLDHAVRLAAVAALLVITYQLLKAIYNVFFHPLRKYPGPLLWRASRLPYLFAFMGGRLPLTVCDLHEKYGLVVRIAPDELSFIEPEAWKDIYGSRGSTEMVKLLRFYRPDNGSSPSILSEENPAHGLLRKYLLPGFSERSMRLQEPMIKHYVDLMIQRLHEHSTAEKNKVFNMTAWFNFVTFDIIGDLAFGEPFDCLQNSDYHPWVQNLSKVPQQQSWLLFARHFGQIWAQLLYKMARGHGEAIEDARRKLERRKALGGDRPDLIQGLIDKNLEPRRLVANAYMITIAGSETTATLLTAVVALLLKHPATLKKLTDEVRGMFESSEEINMESVMRLEYMLACLDEGLRLHPPVSFGLPRVVPGKGAEVAGRWIPGGTVVSICQWAQSHSGLYWEQPWAYKPERFLPGERLKGDNHDAFMPFSNGPRDCIGRNLAYAEMRLVLARILYDFDMVEARPNQNWRDESHSYFLWDKAPLDVYLKPVRK